MRLLLTTLFATVLLTACGGGGSSKGGDDVETPLDKAALSLSSMALAKPDDGLAGLMPPAG